MERILNKKHLQQFLEDLGNGRDVIGPTKKGGGTSTYSHTTFGKITGIEDLDIKYKSSMLSPKSILFPDHQPLYAYKKVHSGVNLENLHSPLEREIVLFGIHSCDIAAIARLDMVFNENNYSDPLYNDRRRKTLVIGLTCEDPQSYCFCQTVGTGPDILKGFDLLMTDLGDQYFVRSGSARGEVFLSLDYFAHVTNGDRRQRENRLENTRRALPKPGRMEAIMEAMGKKYNDDMWDRIADGCCSCGACNMVCPTCHCFTIIDKTDADFSAGKRMRVWDTCHFERFATMAGNLNTREEKASRYKHRLYDKFYYDPHRYGEVFCVGCGRCIEFCPAHINIIPALENLQEE